MEDGVKKGPQGHKEAAEIRGKKYNGRLRGRNETHRVKIYGTEITEAEGGTERGTYFKNQITRVASS